MKKLKKSLVALALTALPTLVFASQSVGDIANNIGQQAKTGTVVMVVLSALLGIILLIMGGMNLKKYADNPNQTPLSKPIIFLAAGALLFGLSSTSTTMQQTIFGSSTTTSSPGDNAFNNAKNF